MVKKRIVAKDIYQLTRSVNHARSVGEKICVAGGRHAMGGQQFLQLGSLVDMTALNKIIHFDRHAGLVEVEAGCLWSQLIRDLQALQKGMKMQWTIAQKQTGCDSLSIGGALAANAHGRGLTMAPIVSDVERFSMLMQNGSVVICSRDENSDLFRLAIGGYGLFGIITSVTLRLVPRAVLRRSVELCDAHNVVEKLESRAANGATYGDFQFQIDHKSADFLRTGILSTYSPIAQPEEFWMNRSVTENKLLTEADWRELLYLAHSEKSAAFEKYSKHYLSTDGQLYSSDTFQLATYVDNYHEQLDKRLGACVSGTELITELYVPRIMLDTFLADAAALLIERNASVIYGTVRLIEKDQDTFLGWAKENWACIVLNLHVNHTPDGLELANKTFCDLIDLAIKYQGSYYLTYHRFASANQLLSCYPQMPTFLKLKDRYDPCALFQSDWYQHCKKLLEI